MKTDLKSLKKELKRLTDVGELKKELNRLATEIRNFDFSTALPPAQRARVEKRYREVKALVSDLQSRLDANFSKLSALVRRGSKSKPAAKRTTTRKATAKKAPRKKTAAKKAR